MASAVPPPLTPFGSALAGALGAVFSNAAVYPLDTVKTRLQASSSSSADDLPKPVSASQGNKSHSRAAPIHARLMRRLQKLQMLSLLFQILRTEGISGAFKGFSANMLNTFSQQFAYFFFHTLLRTRSILLLQGRSPSTPAALSTSAELILGAAAGALAQIFTIPVAVIATRQQLWVPPSYSSSSSSSSSKRIRSPTLRETAQDIIAESGITGLWTGLKPGLVLTVNPAITYGVFERTKSWTLARRPEGSQRLSVAEAFWIGVLSKTLATVVTYPYIFAKVRLQAKDPEDPRARPTGPSTQTGAETSYAAVASHPPASDAPVVAEFDGQQEKSSTDQIPHRTATRHRSAIPLLAAIYKEKGFLGWYQGLTAQIIKAVLCQGILFVSRDQFERYAYHILVALARLRARFSFRA